MSPHSQLRGFYLAKNHMALQIRETSLPTDLSNQYILGSPTRVRPEPLAKAIGSFNDALHQDGLSGDAAAFLIFDSSPSSEVTHADRAKQLNAYLHSTDIPIFFLTHENQLENVAKVAVKTGRDEGTIRAALAGSTCGDGRHALWAITSALAKARDEKRTLLYFDDDLIVEETVPDASEYGSGTPNSHIFFDLHRYPSIENDLPKRPNGSIKKFLDITGLSLEEARRTGIYGPIQATETLDDIMHDQMELAQSAGIAEGWMLPKGKKIDTGIIKTAGAGSPAKYGLFDGRTVNFARLAALNHQIKNEPNSVKSYPAGSAQTQAFEYLKTNVDAACMVVSVDPGDVFPFSILISERISKDESFDPISIVESRPRNDNEGLQVILTKIREQMGIQMLFTNGFDFQVKHMRDAHGRAEPVEQAFSSVIGNLQAMLALDLMNFYGDYPVMDDRDIDEAIIPEEDAKIAYRKLVDLAKIFDEEMTRVASNKDASDDKWLFDFILQFGIIKRKLGVTKVEEKMQSAGKYQEIPLDDWERVAFPVFYDALNRVTRPQLRHYNEILKVTPDIINAVHELIKQGEYKASQVIAAEAPRNFYPKSNRGGRGEVTVSRTGGDIFRR